LVNELSVVEGGVLDNLPTDAVRRIGAEIIIRHAIPPGVTTLTGFSRAAEIIAVGRKPHKRHCRASEACWSPPHRDTLCTLLVVK
jgi:predicted acylesterase/phospholipase RssA